MVFLVFHSCFVASTSSTQKLRSPARHPKEHGEQRGASPGCRSAGGALRVGLRFAGELRLLAGHWSVDQFDTWVRLRIHFTF